MNKDLEAFLKDPQGWVQRQLDSIRQRRNDADNYYQRQKKILEDTYNERVYQLDGEEAGVRHRARRWAAQYDVPWEETR